MLISVFVRREVGDVCSGCDMQCFCDVSCGGAVCICVNMLHLRLCLGLVCGVWCVVRLGGCGHSGHHVHASVHMCH